MLSEQMGAFAETEVVDYPITVCLLSTKENKLPVSFYIYSKQTQVCHFHFFSCRKQLEIPAFR
jgi:hypothetical protein